MNYAEKRSGRSLFGHFYLSFRWNTLFIILLLATSATNTFAHQPRLNQNEETTVLEPEISKAYYGVLSGAPHVYHLDSHKPFNLYVNILTPFGQGVAPKVSARISRSNDPKPIAILDGKSARWTEFFEPYGHDTYFIGPEFRMKAPPGSYEITVYSDDLGEKYVLGIGETESFSVQEIISVLAVVPKLKRDFFGKSPIDFILSPFGFGLVVATFSLSAVTAFIHRLLVTKRLVRNARWTLFCLGIGLFFWIIATSWNPILLFCSAMLVCEALIR